MFTGIIQNVGRIVDIEKTKHGGTLTVRASRMARQLKSGSSIAIDGVCTTIEKIFPIPSSRAPSTLSSRAKSRDLIFTIRLMPVTLKLTTLGSLRVGDPVNLEPSLRVGDELGGHFVFGHVDGVGVIRSSRQARTIWFDKLTTYSSSEPSESRSSFISITVPHSLTRFIVPRGSIAVDGVSLTVVNRRANVFTVSLVDYTLRHTTLGAKQKGDRVNIEIDALARYTH